MKPKTDDEPFTQAGGSFVERRGSPLRSDPDLEDRGLSKHSGGANVEIQREESVTETNLDTQTASIVSVSRMGHIVVH